MSKATLYVALSFLPIVLMGFQNCSIKKASTALNLDTSSSSQTSDGSSNNSNTHVPSSVPAPVTGNTLQAQAITLLQNKCYACHGTVASGGISQINNPDSLIASGVLIAGNPDGSAIYTAAVAGRMPIGSSVLTATELDILRQWIAAGAQKPTDSTSVSAPVQIPLTASYASIQANIITPKCIYCHSGSTAKDGVKLDSYTAVKNYISSTSPSRTKLYSITASGEMPPRPDVGLTTNELKVLGDWITAGAPNN